MPSIRSKIPPWPGKRLPLSLRFICRFIIDSNKSPTTPNIVTSHKPGKMASVCIPKLIYKIAPKSVTPIKAPATPSHVLPGLMLGASLCLPKFLPAKYAALSAIQMVANSIKTNFGSTIFAHIMANKSGNISSQPNKAFAIRPRSLNCLANQIGTISNQKQAVMAKIVKD